MGADKKINPAVYYKGCIIMRVGRRIDVSNENGSIGTFVGWTPAIECVDRIRGGGDERATLAEDNP
jgi:hypothetical protein